MIPTLVEWIATAAAWLERERAREAAETDPDG